MVSKQVVPRAQARADVERAVAYYLEQDAPDAALAFIDALEAAYEQIRRHPAVESPRYDHELNLPGLRAFPLHGYPQIVFYVECKDHIDVWRVLHGRRDISSWIVE